MTKYRDYFLKMVNENKDQFDNFTRVHFEYSIDQNAKQNEFNIEGEKILDIIREYENRLCSNTERGKYNIFSAGLSEKFQLEIRKHFPLIDHIGLVSAQESDTPIKQSKKTEQFSLKKISLK